MKSSLASRIQDHRCCLMTGVRGRAWDCDSSFHSSVSVHPAPSAVSSPHKLFLQLQLHVSHAYQACPPVRFRACRPGVARPCCTSPARAACGVSVSSVGVKQPATCCAACVGCAHRSGPSPSAPRQVHSAHARKHPRRTAWLCVMRTVPGPLAQGSASYI